MRLVSGIGRISRGMTLGVRGLLLKDGHVVLVRHSYLPGWYLPGGGVEAGESLYEALVRELREEAGAVLAGPADLYGIYRNGRTNARDHVALFVCRDWHQPEPLPVPNLEIRACEAFSIETLPEGTTPGTRARIDEVLGGHAPAEDW
jgi:8-oxo-dGTP pyrophosphatase MutT (NUDIX family)